MLFMNLDKWNALTPQHRAIVEMACEAEITAALAESDAAQSAALKEVQAKGVTIHRWSPEILAALQKAWVEVITETAAQDPMVKRTWESFDGFRQTYKLWKEISTVE
jgi:TRAP-type mannitol/chloroaromatic compound transport system substrate-binding protein